MRTARAFTVCWSLLPRVCNCLVPGGGVPAWSGGCTWSQGVYLVLGVVPAWSGGVYGGVPAWSGGCTCLVWGVYLPGSGGTCLVLGGVPAWSGGVPAWSGWGGCTCLVWGCTWSGTPPLWTEWHTLMKILPCPKLRLWVVIIWSDQKSFETVPTETISICRYLWYCAGRWCY